MGSVVCEVGVVCMGGVVVGVWGGLLWCLLFGVGGLGFCLITGGLHGCGPVVWGFGVWGLGFGVWGLGFGVWGFGFGLRL